jgi:CRP-like cAMP-binding protein
MKEDLAAFLSQYISLSNSDMEVITSLGVIKEFGKGTVLLKEGEQSRQCYLILKGCIRSYFIIDGEEKTTEFFTEKNTIVPVSYTKKQPSEYYLACLEDCILSTGTEQTSEIVRQKIPQMENLIRHFNEQLLAESQIKFESYFTLSPEQRYRKLLETRPDLCQRVPQYHLASYLGIKPESLSRIRKRIINNDKSVS